VPALYRALRPSLLRYLSAIVGPDEAEDALHDAFASLLSARAQGAPDPDRPDRYLTRAARNRAIDRLRKRRPAADIDRLHNILRDPSPDPLHLVLAAEAAAAGAAALYAAIDRLPEPVRPILADKAHTALSYRAIAADHHLTVAACRSRGVRGVALLKTILEPDL
jgi:RNA polymerase sigma-70 factor (ECF subfamily)